MINEASGPRELDRRRAPRFPYQANLEIEWGSARLKARTRDISQGGMFIESEDVLWVGAGFRARFGVDRPLWLDCSGKAGRARLRHGRHLFASRRAEPAAFPGSARKTRGWFLKPPYT